MRRLGYANRSFACVDVSIAQVKGLLRHRNAALDVRSQGRRACREVRTLRRFRTGGGIVPPSIWRGGGRPKIPYQGWDYPSSVLSTVTITATVPGDAVGDLPQITLFPAARTGVG